VNGNCYAGNASDPLLGVHLNNVFMLDDADMCSASLWDH
jgi:hypothetical protein